ncbi:MAG: flagellar basal body rod protein FlgC [Clostridiales bacterium]|jgi:flagellar basal-body rod protein FlgC|nr:flagellar basal body rod protein FlgC [Clostridiales bacterium]
MAFMSSLNISGSGLNVQRTRMNIISQNIANAGTTRTEDGGPYRRKIVNIQEDLANEFGVILDDENNRYQVSGVAVAEIVDDPSALKPVYNPSHPDADENGYVMMPNVETTTEMVDIIEASRAYQANVTAFNAMKLMASKAFDIGK